MSSDLDSGDNTELNMNDPLEVYSRLVALSLEEIKEKVGGKLLDLVIVFMSEMEAATAIGGRDQLRMVQTWERWLPLIRTEPFMNELESVIAQLEKEQEQHRENQDAFNMVRNIARDLNRMSEERVKEYFEVRKDPKREAKKITEELAFDEFEKARNAHREGDLLGARIYYRRVIPAFKTTGNDQMLASSIQNLANVLKEEGQTEQAEEHYEQAATIFERVGDMTNLTIALGNLVRSMLSRGDPGSAYQTAMRGIKTARPSELDANAGEFPSLLLTAASELSKREQLECYRNLIQIFDELRLRKDLARTHLLLGIELLDHKLFDEACVAAYKGLRLMVEAEAPHDLVQWAVTTHGRICMAAGQTVEEIDRVFREVFKRPATLARLGDLLSLSLTRDVHAGKLSLDEASRVLREEHKREPFDVRAIAGLWKDLRSAIWVSDEEPRRLTTEFLKMLEINHLLLILVADLAGTQEIGSALHLNLGVVYDQLGKLREAAKTFQEGAELARLAGNTELFITMQLNSSQALERAGDPTAAIKCVELLVEKLKQLDKNIQHPSDYPRVCLKLARLYRGQDQLNEAEATALTALQAVEALHETDPQVVSRLQIVEASLQSLLGGIHKDTDRYVSAEHHLKRSLELARARNDDDGVAIALAFLAGVRSDLNDMDEALTLYNQAYQRIEGSPDPSYAFLYTERARVLMQVGEMPEARRMALLALEMKPTLRQAAKCIGVLLRTANNETEQFSAQLQAEQLLTSDTTPEIKAILLFELLNLETASLEQKNEWTRQVRELSDSFAGLQGAYGSLYIAESLESSGPYGAVVLHYLERCLELIDEVAASNQDRDIQRHIFKTGNRAAQHLLQLKENDNCAGLEIVLRAKARATLNQRFTPARTIEALMNQLSQQEQPVLLVEMYTLPMETLLYFVTAEGLQGVGHIPMTAETLGGDNEIVGKLGDLRVHEAAWRSESWLRLSDAFTSALSQYLQPDQLICLIPAGPWHFLPLHACLLNGRPLIESHPVYYGATSAILSNPGNATRRLDKCLQ